jgi:hypothetical protein
MACVATKIIVDMETLQVVCKESYVYKGPWDQCKGGQSKEAAAAATQQQGVANQLSQQQLDMMRQQLGMQQSQLGKVNAAIDPILANGGLHPDTEAALRSIAMNTLPQTYNNLYGALNNQLVQRGITGGSNAGSGDIARGFGYIGSQEAGQQANLLSQIPLQKEQGLYQALNAGLGVGNAYGNNTALFNQGGLGALGAANQALGVRQNAANAADQASTGFWGSLVGGLAGLGSAGIGKCWAARAVYGETDWRPVIIAEVWWHKWTDTLRGRFLLALYLMFGPNLAWMIKHSSLLKRIAKKLFDRALENALKDLGWKNG